jgi:membrane protein implicated in regulation of membrane protease activity
MAHWPKTLRGNILTVLLIVAATPVVVMVVAIVATALSGPLVWGGLALVALTSVALYIWRRRVDDARERAWVGAFSFGDVVASMRAREALDSLGEDGISAVATSRSRRPPAAG